MEYSLETLKSSEIKTMMNTIKFQIHILKSNFSEKDLAKDLNYIDLNKKYIFLKKYLADIRIMEKDGEFYDKYKRR